MYPSTLWLWIAASLCGATSLIHAIAGSRENVPALLDSDMDLQPKYTLYYCWHLVTIALFAMTAGFSLAAAYPQSWELAAAGILISVTFTLLSFWMIAKSGLSVWALPQWILFTLISAAGAAAFV